MTDPHFHSQANGFTGNASYDRLNCNTDLMDSDRRSREERADALDEMRDIAARAGFYDNNDAVSEYLRDVG